MDARSSKIEKYAAIHSVIHTLNFDAPSTELIIIFTHSERSIIARCNFTGFHFFYPMFRRMRSCKTDFNEMHSFSGAATNVQISAFFFVWRLVCIARPIRFRFQLLSHIATSLYIVTTNNYFELALFSWHAALHYGAHSLSLSHSVSVSRHLQHEKTTYKYRRRQRGMKKKKRSGLSAFYYLVYCCQITYDQFASCSFLSSLFAGIVRRRMGSVSTEHRVSNAEGTAILWRASDKRSIVDHSLHSFSHSFFVFRFCSAFFVCINLFPRSIRKM